MNFQMKKNYFSKWVFLKKHNENDIYQLFLVNIETGEIIKTEEKKEIKAKHFQWKFFRYDAENDCVVYSRSDFIPEHKKKPFGTEIKTVPKDKHPDDPPEYKPTTREMDALYRGWTKATSDAFEKLKKQGLYPLEKVPVLRKTKEGESLEYVSRVYLEFYRFAEIHLKETYTKLEKKLRARDKIKSIADSVNQDIITEEKRKFFYSINEVAELLEVNPMTVRRQISSGNLKATKFGRQWRIKDHDIKSYLFEKLKHG